MPSSRQYKIARGKFSDQSSDLRVISGKFKGQRLMSPANPMTHPMGMREKLALFNMIEVADKSVLDVFAGSGALGIEALSRGAREVIFVENALPVVRVIRQNLAFLIEHDSEIAIKTEVFPQKVTKFIEDFTGRREFEVIFADPPYDKIDFRALQGLVKLMSRGGVLVLSSPAKDEPLELAGAKIRTSRTYAAARLTIYEPADQGQPVGL